jgi:glyoxylase-like metal-dependent hydrolase (beta-lactamase superfamily II)
MNKNRQKNNLTRRNLLTLGTSLLGTTLLGTTSKVALAKAPFLGTYSSTFFRFKLGEFEITTISDGEAVIKTAHPIFGANAKKEEVNKVLKSNLLPENIFNPFFTPTIINTGKEVILFDTGNGDDGFAGRPHAGNLVKQLAVAGFKPEEIDIVVLSHGHSDHIGGVKEKDKEVFTNATYVISEIEFDFWNNKNNLSKGLEKFSKVYDNATNGIKEKFKTIKSGQDVVTGVKAIATHGHTPGHLSFHIESKGQQTLILNDCAHHHVLSLAHPEWHFAFDIDKEQGAKTRKNIFDMCSKDQIPVIGFHMPYPSVGYIEARKVGGYRWVPHSYQLQ